MGRLMVGVSGVRGIVGEDLTAEVARQFGAAFATMLGPGRKIVMGRDTRPSGPMIGAAVTEGLTVGGVDVVDLGIVTTPGVALMIKRTGADGGIVVTASHNPSPYNGIKFMTPEGVNLPAQQADRLKALWQQGSAAPAGRRGGVSANDQTHRIHVAAVLELLDRRAIAARGFRVVLDSINGAGCLPTAMLLKELGCTLVHINGQPNGDFSPHEPEPIARNLQGLCQAVREHKADIGFAQDPDADRLVLVDEQGNFIGEEYTLALTADYVLRTRKGPLATNLSTSRMIDDVAARHGVPCIRTPVGEANVAEGMRRAGAIFGGEGNGGVMDPRVVLVRNSLVGIGLMLAELAETGQTVSELVADLPRYTMLKDKFPCPLGAAEKVLAAVAAAWTDAPGAACDTRDGLKIDLPEGWTHIRASNTEPIMRITTEARTNEAAAELTAKVRRIADGVLG